MPEPQVIGTGTYWTDNPPKPDPKRPGKFIQYDVKPEKEHWGLGVQEPIQWKIEFYEDGTAASEQVDGSGEAQYLGVVDSQKNREWMAKQKAINRDTVVMTRSDGSTYLMDKDTGDAIKDLSGPIEGYTAPGVTKPKLPEEIAAMEAETDYKKALAGQVGKPTPRQALDPSQIAENQARTGLLGAQTGLVGAQTQEAMQKLEGPYLQALHQHENVINELQQRASRGEITLEEASRLSDLSRANLDAAIKGTTPYQMEQDKNKKESDRQKLANDYLQSQLGYGSQLASGLMQGLGGMYSKIYSSTNPPYNFDPFQMAQSYMGQLGGGQEMTDMAKKILSGAFGSPGGGQ